MSFLRLLAFGSVALQLAGCATSFENGPVWPYPEPPASGTWGYEPAPAATPAPRAVDTREPSPQDRREVQQAEPQAASHPTVVALVQQAEDERAAGELDRAAGTLERAIRIVNNDPLPWLKLAEIRFEQGNFVQAENFARRSLSFAARGPTARDSWLLISDIKRLQGDTNAADQARTKASQV